MTRMKPSKANGNHEGWHVLIFVTYWARERAGLHGFSPAHPGCLALFLKYELLGDFTQKCVQFANLADRNPLGN